MIRPRFLFAVLGLLVALQGCEPTYRGLLDVWNRTEAPIKVVGREGTVVVPACDHVSQENFVLNRFEIHDDQDGFIMGLTAGGSDAPAYIVVTSEGVSYLANTPLSDALPECHGIVRGQTPYPPPASGT